MKNLMGLLLVGLLASCGSTENETVVTETASQSVNTEVTNAKNYVENKVETTMASASSNGYSNNSNGYGNNPILANAKAGECYAQIIRPPKYEYQPEKVMVTPESFKIRTIAPTYKKVAKTVVVKEESVRIKTIPATYKTITEEVVVRPASSRLTAVPATYKTVSKKIEVSPATKVWKKGNGDYKAGDNSQNDILCLVDVPAKYRTIKERVLVSAATTRETQIPAITKRIKKTVVATPARTEKITIPAVTKRITVTELGNPAREVKTAIPATYKTVNKKVVVSQAKTTWGRILCKTNQDRTVVLNLQKKLKTAGFNPGGFDGVLGPGTYKAVRTYQKKNGLAVGGVTYETLSHLGIKL